MAMSEIECALSCSDGTFVGDAARNGVASPCVRRCAIFAALWSMNADEWEPMSFLMLLEWTPRSESGRL